MSNDFQSLDIILFAMIAIFLAIRLRNVLGRRDSNDNSIEHRTKLDRSETNKTRNVIELPSREIDRNSENVSQNSKSESSHLNGEQLKNSEIEEALALLSDLDNSFNDENFIVGSRVAFEMVLKAFASGETETLKNLLSNEVYGNFSKVIRDREKHGYSMADTLVEINSAEMVEIYFEEKIANITVKFVTEQIKVTYDKNGNIVTGDPKVVVGVTDFWTFARNTEIQNPNWILVATRSLD